MSKPTWLFIAGTYRSGSTTQYRIVRDIVNKTGNGRACGYHTEPKLAEFDLRTDRFIVCKVFKCLPLDGFKGRLSLARTFYEERRLKALITVRNPLDIITSMMERHRRQLENPKDNAEPFDFHHRATIDFPEWLGDLDKWADLPDTYVARFEKFTADLEGEVNRIGRYLGIPLDPALSADIARRHTVDGIREYKKAMRDQGKREDPWLPAIPGILFGRPNVYQDHLTPAQIALMKEYNGQWMMRWGYL